MALPTRGQSGRPPQDAGNGLTQGSSRPPAPLLLSGVSFPVVGLRHEVWEEVPGCWQCGLWWATLSVFGELKRSGFLLCANVRDNVLGQRRRGSTLQARASFCVVETKRESDEERKHPSRLHYLILQQLYTLGGWR